MTKTLVGTPDPEPEPTPQVWTTTLQTSSASYGNYLLTWVVDYSKI